MRRIPAYGVFTGISFITDKDNFCREEWVFRN